MSTAAQELLRDPQIGPLAAMVGLGRADALAIRRHGEREESRGDWAGALETYRVSILVEPGNHDNWYALARALRANGDAQSAVGALRVGDLLKEKMR